MKKIFLILTMLFLLSCTKSNNNSTANRTSYTGTLIIGPSVRQLNDYSEHGASAGYMINGNVQSSMPACFATDKSAMYPTDPFFIVQMTDSRPDTLSSIQFNIPSFTTFANYGSLVYINIGGTSITAVANISFTFAGNDGTFAMLGKAGVASGDSLNFSYNGSFKNMARQ
jgi:hypothetical protein